MSTLGRRDLLLLLIGLDESNCARRSCGITRIQKDCSICSVNQKAHLPLGEGFKFEAYKAAHISSDYDDLELLRILD